MKKLSICLLLNVMLALSLMSMTASAKNIISVDDTKVLAEQMMSHYIKKEFSEGIAVARPHWPLPKVELDNLIKTIETQWPVVDKRFGEAIGFELAQVKKIGDSFIRYYYLHKFNNHAIFWRIDFYKPMNEWVINGVSFRDNLDILYE